jgi:hypothetical protein
VLTPCLRPPPACLPACLPPPACLPACPLQASGLVADLLGAAEQQQLHWRYRCLAEIALCMLLPLLDAASGAAVARHWTGGGRCACVCVPRAMPSPVELCILPLHVTPVPARLPGRLQAC